MFGYCLIIFLMHYLIINYQRKKKKDKFNIYCFLFVCVGVLRPVNKEFMSSQSINSGTVPGQA